jgi:hypothetical protein
VKTKRKLAAACLLAARAIDFVNADSTGLALMHVLVADIQSEPLSFPSACVQGVQD